MENKKVAINEFKELCIGHSFTGISLIRFIRPRLTGGRISRKHYTETVVCVPAGTFSIGSQQ